MEMTRGEILDHLAKFSAEDADYRKALIADPKTIVAKQFNMELPDNVSIRVIEDTADTVHIVLPYQVEAGAELSDADLEAVAGGHTIVKKADCSRAKVGSVVSIETGLY